MKEEKKEEKKIDSKIIKVRGVAKFPMYDDEEQKFTSKLCITDSVLAKIEKVCDEIGDDIAVGEFDIEGTTYNSINVKTSFEIPVYDKEGHALTDDDYEIYDNAKVIMKLQLKRYEYTEKKRGRGFTKTGVTAYLLGAVVLEQGTKFANDTTFDDFKEELLDENNENIEF